MIQLNLLPEVKLDYVKAQRTKRLVASVAVILCVVSIAILVIIFAFDIYQKHRISSLNSTINSEVVQLKNSQDINKVLTLQDQLNSLTPLHSSKPNALNLFNYLNEVTPSLASINNLTINFVSNSVTLSGTADNINTVNQYVDTLKLTTYVLNSDNANDKNAFSSVVLSSFALGSGNVTYGLTFNFDPSIFSVTQKVNLSVPSTTTTRLELNNPTDLFSAASQKTLDAINTSAQGGQ